MPANCQNEREQPAAVPLERCFSFLLLRHEKLQRLAMWGKANSLAVSNIWLIDNETPFKGISANLARCVGVSQDNLGRYVWRFGDDFKGSPLETVLDSIAEQKQVLKEPPICFYWNPRCGSRTFTRIRATNRHSVFFWSDASAQPPKTAYCGRFGNLDRRQIKELGPAVTSILYFLHPTAFPTINSLAEWL